MSGVSVDGVDHCDDCKAPLEDHEQGFCPHEIETGERVADSSLTGKTYLVTRWVNKGDGQLVSLQKVEIERPRDTDTHRDGDRA